MRFFRRPFLPSTMLEWNSILPSHGIVQVGRQEQKAEPLRPDYTAR